MRLPRDCALAILTIAASASISTAAADDSEPLDDWFAKPIYGRVREGKGMEGGMDGEREDGRGAYCCTADVLSSLLYLPQ